MIKTFILISALVQTAHAQKVKSKDDLMKSPFCQEFACDDTSPYKDKDGNMAIQIRLAKDPLNFDLLGQLKGSNFSKLTFKFTNDEGVVNKTAFKSLVTSLLGKAPSEPEVDKIVAAALLKTKKVDLPNAEVNPLDKFKVRAGNVLKKPTVVIEY